MATPIISFSPHGTNKDILMDWRECLGQWIDAAKEVPDAAVAWFFPKKLEPALFVNSPNNGHCFPGIIMLLKESKGQQS